MHSCSHKNVLLSTQTGPNISSEEKESSEIEQTNESKTGIRFRRLFVPFELLWHSTVTSIHETKKYKITLTVADLIKEKSDYPFKGGNMKLKKLSG